MFRTVSSIIRTPTASIAWHEVTGAQKDDVHYPPDTQPTEGQQLPHGYPDITETESVHAEKSQQNWEEEGSDEVVTAVSVGRFIIWIKKGLDSPTICYFTANRVCHYLKFYFEIVNRLWLIRTVHDLLRAHIVRSLLSNRAVIVHSSEVHVRV